MEDLEQGSAPTRAPEELPAAEAPGGENGSDAQQASARHEAAATPREAAAKPRKPPRTRISATFQAFLLGAVVLILLLIFILENTETVRINYLGAKGHVSLGVALLLAVAGGALLVAIVAAARISQLRLHERRERRR